MEQLRMMRTEHAAPTEAPGIRKMMAAALSILSCLLFSLMPADSRAQTILAQSPDSVVIERNGDTIIVKNDNMTVHTYLPAFPVDSLGQQTKEQLNASLNLTLQEALRLYQQRHYTEAVAKFRQAAEAGHHEAQWWMGKMYADSLGVASDDAEAVRWFRKSADQGNPHALNRMAYIHLAQQNFEQALRTIDRAIAAMPGEANYYDSKGEILYRKGDKQGARRMWEKVVALDPAFPQKYSSTLYKLLFGTGE